MKKMIPFLGFLLLLSACRPAPGVPAAPTALPRPTIAAYAPPTPAAPSIFPPDSVELEISSPFGRGTISQVAWSPDGRLIAAGGSEGIRFYTADTLEEIRVIPTDFLITSIAFSPDGKLLASGSADRVFSSRAFWRRFSPWGSKDNYVQLWDVETGDLLATLEAGLSYVTAVAFNPAGDLLASGSMYPDDDAIRIWRLAAVMDGDLAPWQLHKEHTYGVFGVAFSPDGKTLLSGGGDNSARLWDVYGEQMESILMYRVSAEVKVFAVAYSPVPGDDGEQFVALAGADFIHNTPTALLELWDASSGELALELDGHDSSVDSVAFSPDGTILASGGGYPDNDIRLWNAGSGELLRVLKGHHSGVRSLAFSPDGRTLASGGWDAMLYLWDVQTGELKMSNDEHTSVVYSAALSPDGRILATGGDAGLIRLWDAASGAKTGVLNAQSSRITSLVFSADGSTLIAGADEPDFNIQLWDVGSGERIGLFEGHRNFVQVMALSPDGRFLASGGALGDNAVRVWNIEDGNSPIYVIAGHLRSVKSLAFSADGRFLATGDGRGTLRLVDAASGEIRHTIEGHACAITALAFDPGTGNLFSGGCDGLVRFWDVESGELLGQFAGPDEVVTQLGFNGAGGELTTGFKNGALWFWDLALLEPVVKIEGVTDDVQTLAFEDGKIVAVLNDGGGTIRLLEILR